MIWWKGRVYWESEREGQGKTETKYPEASRRVQSGERKETEHGQQTGNGQSSLWEKEGDGSGREEKAEWESCRGLGCKEEWVTRKREGSEDWTGGFETYNKHLWYWGAWNLACADRQPQLHVHEEPCVPSACNYGNDSFSQIGTCLPSSWGMLAFI